MLLSLAIHVLWRCREIYIDAFWASWEWWFFFVRCGFFCFYLWFRFFFVSWVVLIVLLFYRFFFVVVFFFFLFRGVFWGSEGVGSDGGCWRWMVLPGSSG